MRVVLHGLPYFCAKLQEILRDEGWDVRFHPSHSLRGLFKLTLDLAHSDLAFTWGGRVSMGMFLWAARLLRKRNIVILWCGSDVLYAKADLEAGRRSSWIAEKIHWAVSPVLTEEVRALGLECEFVQTSFTDSVRNVVPLPEKFSVLAFVPGLQKGTLYGLDHIQAVASLMPDVEFKTVGWLEGERPIGPPNLKILGRSEDLTPFYQQATVVWRPVQHDAGVSFMVLEALAQGRHVIYSYPFPECVQATTVERVHQELRRLQALHAAGNLHLNQAGIKIVAEVFSPEKVRATLLYKWNQILCSGRANPESLLEKQEFRDSSPVSR